MSIMSDLLHKVLLRSKIKYKLNKEIEENKPFIKNYPKDKMFRNIDIIEKSIIDNSYFIFKQRKTLSDKYIFYIHGGAYFKGLSHMYYKFIKTLLYKTKMNLIALDYPLIPYATKDDIYEYIYSVYIEIIKDIKEEDIIIVGDSAGGGLSLGFELFLKEKNHYHKHKMILISPWLDLSLKNKEIDSIDEKDPILDKNTLIKIGDMYSKNDNKELYFYSPINGDLSDLGSISVFIGTYDILYPDTYLLKEKGLKYQQNIELHVYDKMLHTWVFFGIKESMIGINDIVNIIVS